MSFLCPTLANLSTDIRSRLAVLFVRAAAQISIASVVFRQAHMGFVLLTKFSALPALLPPIRLCVLQAPAALVRVSRMRSRAS
jgi:hypothetical protein